MPSFNSFDLVIYICLVLALIIGFSSGLLRSLATILGYLAASAVVVMFGSWAVQTAADRLHMPPAQNWIKNSTERRFRRWWRFPIPGNVSS